MFETQLGGMLLSVSKTKNEGTRTLLPALATALAYPAGLYLLMKLLLVFTGDPRPATQTQPQPWPIHAVQASTDPSYSWAMARSRSAS